MDEVLMRTDPVELPVFQSGIYLSEASVLSPVDVFPNRGFQYLGDIQGEYANGVNQWMTYAGLAGVAQYSLDKGPAGVLARFELHHRDPFKEEMEQDFQDFGDQVLGPLVEEVAGNPDYAKAPKFRFFGEWHHFTGPSRLDKSRLISRVFSGELPTDVSSLVAEVDELKDEDRMQMFRGYQFIHAVDGKVSYSAFDDTEGYDSNSLGDFGIVEKSGREMVFYPRGDRSAPRDLSFAIKTD